MYKSRKPRAPKSTGWIYSHLESFPSAPTSHIEMAQETWEDHCSFPSSEMWVMHLAWPSTPRPSKCRHPGCEMPVVSQELGKEMISGKRCSAQHAHLTMNLFCSLQQGPSCLLNLCYSTHLPSSSGRRKRQNLWKGGNVLPPLASFKTQTSQFTFLQYNRLLRESTGDFTVDQMQQTLLLWWTELTRC